MDKIALKMFKSNSRKLTWYCRNFITTSCGGNSLLLITRTDLRSTTTNGFNFRMINSLIESWGLSLIWLDCEFKVSHCNAIKEND